MMTNLRWIGSLSNALQAGLDRAVSAELHSITSDICQSKAKLKRAVGRSALDSGCDRAADNANSASPEKIAA